MSKTTTMDPQLKGLDGEVFMSDVTFPSVSGRNLNRRQRQLPEDFSGQFNLVFVAFQQWQQQQVDSWIPALKTLISQWVGLEYYELPVISDRNMLWRVFINEGMRAGIPNEDTRDRTITLYLDKEEFRQSLNLHDEKDIYVLLIDHASRIRWRSRGWHSDEKLQQLQAALSAASAVEA